MTAAQSDAGALVREVAAEAKRREDATRARRLATRTAEEPVVRLLEDGQGVAVALCGARGRDREMLLDVDAWEGVKARWGTRWVIEPRGGGLGLCVTPEGSDPVWPLLEHVAGVKPADHHLVLANRSLLDMRRSNIEWVPTNQWVRIWSPEPGVPVRPRDPARDRPENREASRVPTLRTAPNTNAAPPTALMPPHVVLHDGRPVMSVGLQGDLARGRRFVVDLVPWDRVVQFLGAEWTVREPLGPEGPAYVISSHAKARATAQRGAGSVVLARWLARAAEGQVVTYRNGNTLDLTGRNLVPEDRGEFWEAHRVHRGAA